MLPPKEKAEQLVEMFMNINMDIKQHPVIHYPTAKQCALLTVDEMFYVLPDIQELWDYWKQVKQEIKQL